MTQFKHTPAPWVAKKHEYGYYIFIDDKDAPWDPIVSTWGANIHATKANARLIAAAPELLNEMIKLAKALEDTGHEPEQSFYDAIKKATLSDDK